MTDATIATDMTPGIRGQTRSTWRDENHLRGLLLKLLKQYPNAEQEELQKPYLLAAKGKKFRAAPANEALIDEALLHVLDNDYKEIHKAYRRRQRQRPALSEDQIAAAEQRLAKIVLLDFVLPNGKKLRDCTGRECAAAGGWLLKVANHVGADAIVGDKLSETQLAKIFADK
jgi:hypothetical protein